MRVTDTLYQTIFTKVPPPPPETGGILGGQCGLITHCHFDSGQCTQTAPAHYQPDSELLNRVIQVWQADNIQFYGLFHSHYPHDTKLSPGDRKYISKIMLSMPPNIHTLYFPLILPGTTVISYRVDRYDSDVRIVCDKIEISKMEVNLP